MSNVLLLTGPAPVLLLPAPIPIKLDWSYDQTHDCETAFHNGYMIKAERDLSPSNPFEDWDGNWPIMIYTGSSDFTVYDKVKGVSIDAPLDRFTDGQLIHDQKAIAQAIDTDPNTYCEVDQAEAKYHTDAEFLRRAFEDAIGNMRDGDKIDAFAALYGLLGYPVHNTTSRGYSQGDWAEVLVVATPEAVTEFGCTEVNPDDLESTADLWGAWAWGDVYGYTLWAPTFDEDGEIDAWEQLDGSCWGYYGDDHRESGLEEGALCEVPDEPVRVPDTFQIAEAA